MNRSLFSFSVLYTCKQTDTLTLYPLQHQGTVLLRPRQTFVCPACSQRLCSRGKLRTELSLTDSAHKALCAQLREKGTQKPPALHRMWRISPQAPAFLRVGVQGNHVHQGNAARPPHGCLHTPRHTPCHAAAGQETDPGQKRVQVLEAGHSTTTPPELIN